MGYCQNCLKRYLSYPVEHLDIVFKLRNLVRKKCPVSGKVFTLSTVNKRRSSAEVVTRLEVTPNIVKGVELLRTLVLVTIGTVETNFPKSEFDKIGQKSRLISRNRC